MKEETRTIYLDNAATTSIDEDVLNSMMPFLKDNYGNPSSIHLLGRVARTAIEDARKIISKHLNATPSEIFFTSCGTESNNMAITGVVRDMGIKNIVTSKVEHRCVSKTIESLVNTHHVKIHYVHLLNDGHVDLAHLDQLLDSIKGDCLVSLMHANNESGNIMDLKQAGEICKKHHTIFHSDTVQTVGHFNIDLEDINIHLISGSGHKFHGPKGSGFIYINRDLDLKPMILGGPQERNMRAGTENVAFIVGLGRAFEIAYNHIEKDAKYIQGLKNYMIEELKKNIPGVSFLGDYGGNSLYTVLNVLFPEAIADEMLLFNLDIAGVCASSGSACGSGANKSSHVIEAMLEGTKKRSVRFSFCKNNVADEIDIVISILKKLLKI